MCPLSPKCVVSIVTKRQVGLGLMANFHYPPQSLVYYGNAALYSHFFSNLPYGMFYRTLFSGLLDGGVEFLQGNGAFDSKYPDDMAILSDSAQATQRTLDCLVIEISRYCVLHPKDARHFLKTVRGLCLHSPLVVISWR